MIERVIEWSAKNTFLVSLALLFLMGWGVWAVYHTSLDAIPDLSDVQVIVYSEWPGRSPDLVEDQITYPISSALLSTPGVEVVRGQSAFGASFVYVIFDENVDLYWARSRVSERLAGIRANLPA